MRVWNMIRMEGGNDALVSNAGANQNWRTDIQVAINDGNRREDVFFTVKVGKSGTSLPFQQPIPMDFARVHPELHGEVVTLESPSSSVFRVVVLHHSDGMRFGKGWRQFSVENHLREGYRMLFTLVRKLHFVVTFFDNRGKSHTSFPPPAPQPAEPVVQALNLQASPAPSFVAATSSDYHARVGKKGSEETLRSDHTMSRAMRLLQQQECMKFSEIVSTCQRRRQLSDKDRSRTLKAAMRFASALQNQAKFLAVMCDAQVYHGFHLPIPREILEVTGTLQQLKEVKVCLTDREKAFYVANWAWHAFCETPLLNNDGWAKFALDHTLEEGDVCVFELTELNELTDFGNALIFCVHIFRAEVEADHAGHTPLHSKLAKKSAATECELTHRKRSITDLGLPSQPRKARTANNLQPLWTKLIKPRVQARSLEGSRGQSRQI